MQTGVGRFINRLFAHPELASRVEVYIQRLTAIEGIKNIDLHVEEVTGEDKTIDVVVDIFNRVNSGGTKLSQGDLGPGQDLRWMAGGPAGYEGGACRVGKGWFSF